MSEPIKLNAIKIEVPNPEGIEFHDFGFMDSLGFYQEISKKIAGRELRLLEIMNLGLNIGLELGSAEYYPKTDKRSGQIFLYVEESLKDKYPMNLFLRGHEESHVLQHNIMNHYPLLETRLHDVGLNFSELPQNSEFAQHLAGFLALRLEGICPTGNRQMWRKFLKQAEKCLKGFNDRDAYEKAFELAQRN